MVKNKAKKVAIKVCSGGNAPTFRNTKDKTSVNHNIMNIALFYTHCNKKHPI